MKPQPYVHPSVWRGPELATRDDWIIHLDSNDVAEMEAALVQARSRGTGIPALKREDFPLPQLAPKIRQVYEEMAKGRGFVLVRGLPIQRYSKADAALIYWGLGMHLGSAAAQNAQGDVLGHVRDLGADWKTNMKARGYQTRSHLPFHNDSTDVVGLLCLHEAKSGGESRIVSSTAIHNEILAERPDLWKVLCEPFCVDRRGEESEGQKPFYVTPCFNMLHGKLFVRYNRNYIQTAQRLPEVPRLSAQQEEALEMMDSLCNDPRFYLDMSLEPGDMQFICNYVVLHSRTDYEDWPEPQRKRHLLRLWLWLSGDAFKELPAAFADRNSDMLAWQSHPRSPLFDLAEIAAELSH